MTYSCDHCRNAPKGKYPIRWQWKTERGFLNHRCYKTIREEQERMEESRIRSQKERHEKFLASAKHKKGEKVWFVGHTVTKPTHEPRGTRMVHVRYEEERRYWCAKGEIVKLEDGLYFVRTDFGMKTGQDRDCFDTEAAAKKEKEYRAKGYSEHCQFASRCR